MQPGYVYTLTTTTGQGKGTAASPAQATLPLPYSDTFASDTVGQQPRYLSQMQGAFEVEPCAGGRTGQCLQQQAATEPIEWDNNANPYTIGGNLSWANYTVSADALMEQAGAVQLLGRVGTSRRSRPADINDYYLQLSNTGAWSIVRNTTSGTLTTLASGTVTAPGLDTWQHLSLTFNGNTISAAINGTTVGTVTDSAYASGMIGLGTNGYQTDQFDDLSVTLVGVGHADRPDHRGRRHRRVRRRQRRLHRARHQGADVGLQRQRVLAELDHGEQRHHRDQRPVPGHHRRQLLQRHPDRGVDLQRRRQPAVDCGQRRAGQPGLRQVP